MYRYPSRLLLLPILLAAFLGGCLEDEQLITLNPDGSGKLTIDAVYKIDPQMVAMFGGDADSQDEIYRRVVDMLLFSVDGVDVWSDVDYKPAGDDAVHIRGTAYFKNFSDLGSINVSGRRYRLEKGAKGTMTLYVTQEKSEEEAEPMTLSDEQLATSIDSLRREYATNRGQIAPVIAGIDERITFRLPGKQSITGGFKLDSLGRPYLSADGERMLAVVDSLMADDAFMRQMITSNTDGSMLAGQILFGANEHSVTMTGATKPLFDYKKEAAAARKAKAAMYKRLGMEEKKEEGK